MSQVFVVDHTNVRQCHFYAAPPVAHATRAMTRLIGDERASQA
jgi:hypothetical protein